MKTVFPEVTPLTLNEGVVITPRLVAGATSVIPEGLATGA
jgi:hypothetical protein